MPPRPEWSPRRIDSILVVVAGNDVREVGDSGGGPNQAGDDRDLTADDRDQRAVVHDEASEDRDRNADARDVRAVDRERAGNLSGAPDDRAAAFRDRQGGAVTAAKRQMIAWQQR